ncbi:MAG: ornithine cyclodeaminase family protein [Bacteroidales bacterium]|nr:ornithine cyclodeaminase family protein [Bacteroidales bacterium]
MRGITIRIISQEEVAEIFKGNADAIFGIVEDAFRKYLAGATLMPDKISQIFDEQSQNRINCMPATLMDEKVCGMKWVSVFPSNAPKGIQNVTGVMLLSELETGFPVAVIDGTLSTKMRTAAVGCVAARYLAPSKVEVVGIIGAGEEARMHFALLKHMFPTIKECRVSSRSAQSEQRFAEAFRSIVPDVSFVTCGNDSHACAGGADIIVTAISGQSPVLKAADITKGGLYIHVGGWEDEYGVALKADKIVVDNWEASKHRTQTICRMYKEGLLQDSDIYANLSDLVGGLRKGRENDAEFIYFNSVGLSYIDTNFAHYIFREARKRGLGRDVVLAAGSGVHYEDLI